MFIICGMDAHDNTLTNRIGVGRGAGESMTVKNTKEGREKLFQYLPSRKTRQYLPQLPTIPCTPMYTPGNWKGWEKKVTA